jgi:hypothetical protein
VLGAWTSQDLGLNYGGAPAIIYAGYLFQFGGNTVQGVSGVADVRIMAARIFEDGSLAPAQQVGTFSSARSSAGLIQWEDLVYVVGGGQGGVASTLVTRIQLGPNGTLLSIRDVAPLAVGNAGTPSAFRYPVIGDIAYMFRGLVTNQLVACRVTRDGLQDMRVVCESPEADTYTGVAAFVQGQNLVFVGGSTGATFKGQTWSLRVSGFSCGPWRRGTELPGTARLGVGAIVGNHLIYGGGRLQAGAPINSSSVYSAQIDGDGNIGTFSKIGEMDVPISSCASLVYNKYLYAVAGVDNNVATSNLVQRARIFG